MYEQLFKDLQLLNELGNGDEEKKRTIANHTLLTRKGLSSVVKRIRTLPQGQILQLNEAEEQKLVSAILTDLGKLKEVPFLQEQLARLEEMEQSYKALEKHVVQRPQYQYSAHAQPSSLGMNTRNEVHHNSMYRGSVMGGRASVAGSNASRLSTASVQSTFFRQYSSNVVTSKSINDLIQQICGSAPCRKKIADDVLAVLKKLKSNSNKNIDAIHCLEQYIVILLLRTDLPLNVLFNTLMTSEYLALAKTNSMLEAAFFTVRATTLLTAAGEEQCFAQTQANCTLLIKEVLPAIITPGKAHSLALCLQKAKVLTSASDVDETESTTAEHTTTLAQ